MRDWSTFVITVALFIVVLMTRGPALPSRAAEADLSNRTVVVEHDERWDRLALMPDEGEGGSADKPFAGQSVIGAGPGWRGVIENVDWPWPQL